jgi:hypothetical protein
MMGPMRRKQVAGHLQGMADRRGLSGHGVPGRYAGPALVAAAVAFVAVASTLVWPLHESVGPSVNTKGPADSTALPPAVAARQARSDQKQGYWERVRIGKHGMYGNISCGSRTFCAGFYGPRKVVFFNGKSWGSPQNVGAEINSLTCVHEFCIAPFVDYSTPGVGGVLYYKNGTWTKVQIGDGSIGRSDVGSCVTETFCVLTDPFSGTAWVYDGTNWTQYPDLTRSGLWSPTCPTTSFCMAASAATMGSASYVQRFDGTSWSQRQHIDNGDSLEVSCASVTFCMASDQLGRYLTYNGDHWSNPKPFSQNRSGTVWPLSCVPRRYCVASPQTGGLAVYRSGDWRTFKELPIHSGWGQVSCASRRLCVAVDYRRKHNYSYVHFAL